MIHLDADVVVIGSGAGGGAASRQLARAGLDVVLLELGARQTPASFTQREHDMMPRLFMEAGARTTVDRAIQVLQGKGVGGSTLHNINLCKRIDEELLAVWAKTQDLPDLGARLAPHYDAIEELLSISEVPLDKMNANNAVLKAGAETLGWKNGPLKHNRKGCIGSGFCELGCAYDAKMNSARVLIPDAEAHGARVFAGYRATKLLHQLGDIHGVRGDVLNERDEVVDTFQVSARGFVLAASATGSAALALASGLRDPHRQLGRGLTLHPGATVGGLFEREIVAWQGIPQTWECTEFLHPTDPARRIWIVPVFGHPIGVTSMLPGIGAEAVARLGRYRHVAAVTPMLHDLSTGWIDVQRDGRPSLHYALNNADLRMMAQGLSASARLLLAGGAEQVLIPTAIPQVVRTDAEATAVADLRLGRLDPPLAAVHPMGGMRMGGDPRFSVVDGEGRHHHHKNLWVADGSLFPTSTGVPPQWSIYSLGHLVGDAAGARLRA